VYFNRLAGPDSYAQQRFPLDYWGLHTRWVAFLLQTDRRRRSMFTPKPKTVRSAAIFPPTGDPPPLCAHAEEADFYIANYASGAQVTFHMNCIL
jgi:hypothetical protein